MNDNENHPKKYMRRTAQQVISFRSDGEMGVCVSSNERHQVAGWKRNVDWECTMKAQKESKRANTKYNITMLDSRKPQNELS